MRRHLSLLYILPVVFLWGVTAVVAQDRTCDLIDSRQVNSITQTGGRVSHVTRPRFLCTDGTRIEADSSVTFEANSFTQLFGNVLFRDGPQELLAERAQYFSRAGRLQAQGSVSLTDLDDGSTITGENLIMLQAGDDRPEDDMTMRGGRPHARFLSKAVPVSDSLPADELAPDSIEVEPRLADSRPDSLPDSIMVEPDTMALEEASADTLEVEVVEPEPPAPPTTFDVDADMIRLVGDQLFQARGRVEIRQDSLFAYGDSMQYAEDIGTLTLFHNARILSPNEESGDTLDVRGDTIDMRLPNNRIDELEARGHAHLVTESVDMRGPIVRIFFVREELDRIVSVLGAWQEEAPVEEDPSVEEESDSLEVEVPDPFARPQATAEDFLLTGDSIEVKTPGGDLESVFASGGAHGVSSGRSSLNAENAPEFIRNDWIEGQTITATFVENVPDSTPRSSAPGESRYRLDLLVAQGGARSFYRSAADSTAEPGASPSPLELNYVIGDEIRLFMDNGEVDRMEVDNATGAYFQPDGSGAPAGEAPVGDTLTAPPPDTSSTSRGRSNPTEESRTNERLQPRLRNR